MNSSDRSDRDSRDFAKKFPKTAASLFSWVFFSEVRDSDYTIKRFRSLLLLSFFRGFCHFALPKKLFVTSTENERFILRKKISCIKSSVAVITFMCAWGGD